MSAKLDALAGPLAGQSFSLPPVLTTIGADPFSHITWDDPKLAPQHTRITWQGGCHVLADLAISHGTAINGRRVRAPRTLQSGDEIRIGQSLFRYVSPGQEQAVATPADAPLQAKRHASRKELRAPRLPPLPLVLALVTIALASVALLIRWALPDAVPTGSPSETATPAINSAPTGAATPEPNATFTPLVTPMPASEPRAYPVPVPISPADSASGAQALLQWSWRGTLGTDEWYSVWLWREDEEPHSLAWTKETRYEIGESIGAGRFSWQVTVVQGAIQGNWQRDLSAPSEARRFTLLPLTPTRTPSRTATHTATATPSPTVTITPTPEPMARIMVAGRVYDARGDPSTPLANVSLRIYLGGHRATASTNALGQYVVEFSLSGRGGHQQIELLASLPGFEPGVGNASLSGYAPGMTEQVNLDLELYPQATSTPTWIPPTATPSPWPTPTLDPTATHAPTAATATVTS